MYDFTKHALGYIKRPVLLNIIKENYEKQNLDRIFDNRNFVININDITKDKILKLLETKTFGLGTFYIHIIDNKNIKDEVIFSYKILDMTYKLIAEPTPENDRRYDFYASKSYGNTDTEYGKLWYDIENIDNIQMYERITTDIKHYIKTSQ